MREVRERVSGVCQPVYVLDIPGGHGKVPIGPQYVDARADAVGDRTVTDPHGRRHAYPDD